MPAWAVGELGVWPGAGIVSVSMSCEAGALGCGGSGVFWEDDWPVDASGHAAMNSAKKKNFITDLTTELEGGNPQKDGRTQAASSTNFCNSFCAS